MSSGPVIPFDLPGFLLNSWTMRTFNTAVYQRQKLAAAQDLPQADNYFFPLDKLRNWNRLYGNQGIVQYQFVLPTDAAAAGMRQVLTRVSGSGKGSFLTVLKRFGPHNANLLSFPHAGMTLTLDFKMEPDLLPLLAELDAMVLDHGGRHYLAKDFRMSEAVFKRSYPNWEQFMTIKQQVDPHQRFASQQSTRIGLTRAPESRSG